MRILAAMLLLTTAAWAAGAAAGEPDPAQRFLGTWEGPANVYDDLQAMRPTTAHVVVRRSRDDERWLVVEVTVFDNKLSRFTHCEPVNAGELRVRDDVLVGERRVKVDGVLRARRDKFIDEAQIRFFVETPQGDYRPYYAIVFAAEPVPAAPPAKPAAAPAAAPSAK